MALPALQIKKNLMTLPEKDFVITRIAGALILAVGPGWLPLPAHAQVARPVFETGARDTASSVVALCTRLRIRSSVLHETREVIVSTPPVIVVAIVNTQRDRDFTPKLIRTNELPPGVETAGGSESRGRRLHGIERTQVVEGL